MGEISTYGILDDRPYADFDLWISEERQLHPLILYSRARMSVNVNFLLLLGLNLHISRIFQHDQLVLVLVQSRPQEGVGCTSSSTHSCVHHTGHELLMSALEDLLKFLDKVRVVHR